ncbi:hypothetical protein B0X58_01355 [Helicobacter pylori]|uniref:hypothetical protein n=1 Tax=Helicobacter pylori TaxID=210 RepID=UPI0011796C68|nr:hypothetical protein [Helicobacter pylori]OOQ32881.1 hypothetical protein B0X58_01355 [Helicobacter pylori]
MVEKLKLGGLVLALYPYNRDFTGFGCPNAFDLTRLRKILLLDYRGKINPLVRAKCSIIKF